MLVGVCDFPSRYPFPPRGYGGIERWLWAAAVGARRAGADVHLLGPQWVDGLDGFTRRPIRLEDAHRADEFRDYDLLVVGHEYPSLPAWRAVADHLDTQVATFQHWPYFPHTPDAFDGDRIRLYCYSDEMTTRYADQKPVQELAVHLDPDPADPPSAVDGRDLLWLGRIDAQKAPHLAIRAAALLRRRIRIAGPVFDPGYVQRHAESFTAPHVEMAGELGGTAKRAALRDAGTLLYTCGRDYIEAGAAVFGEALRAGTPVAALAWRSGTCAHAALCDATGSIATIDPSAGDAEGAAGDAEAAAALAEAIDKTTVLRADAVQQIGLARFDPARHFRALAARP